MRSWALFQTRRTVLINSSDTPTWKSPQTWRTDTPYLIQHLCSTDDLQTIGIILSGSPGQYWASNLGTSPNHARNVRLVLSFETGLVSPQFHVGVDDLFETTRPTTGNPIGECNWQFISGIHKYKKATQRKQPSDTTPNTYFTPVNRPKPTSTNDAVKKFDNFQIAQEETFDNEMVYPDGFPDSPE